MEPFKGLKQFNFFTYDLRGNDKVVPIFAENTDLAYEKFMNLYGKDHPVDMIVEEK